MRLSPVNSRWNFSPVIFQYRKRIGDDEIRFNGFEILLGVGVKEIHDFLDRSLARKFRNRFAKRHEAIAVAFHSNHVQASGIVSGLSKILFLLVNILFPGASDPFNID